MFYNTCFNRMYLTKIYVRWANHEILFAVKVGQFCWSITVNKLMFFHEFTMIKDYSWARV